MLASSSSMSLLSLRQEQGLPVCPLPSHSRLWPALPGWQEFLLAPPRALPLILSQEAVLALK